jgi:single-stranded DNA-binding protein
MGIEVSGKLHTINETKQVSERFSKREFVVELTDNPKYPQLVLFQLTGDRCTQLDDFKQGDEVRIEFSLRGREWRSPQGELKYFNSLDVWKLEPARGQRRASGSGPTQQQHRSSDVWKLEPGRASSGRRAGGSGPNQQHRGDPRDVDIPPRGDDDFRPRGGADDDLPF